MQIVIDIDKEDYKEILDDTSNCGTLFENRVFSTIQNGILPPKTKKGHWIPIYQGDEIINYRCSECELGDTNGSTDLYGWDYCRRCGAKMESEDKE